MVSGSCACTSIGKPKSVGKLPLISCHDSPASSLRITSQCFCMNSTPGRVGCIAMHPTRPGVLFMQKHWDVMRSDDAGESWHEISGNLPTDFGFPIDVHAHEPDTIYVVPIKSDSEHSRPT